MIVKNGAQLKSWIKSKSEKLKINENIILQNYMLERLLERISVSKYKYNFLLKGGMLITAIVGINLRNTLDIDTTIKGFDLEKENLENILNEIININLNDGVLFEIQNLKEIRGSDEYGGYRVSIISKFDKLNVPMKLDITTGDVITPKEVKYNFNLMFEERIIEILAYNLETVIADKFETIISRNIETTRIRDFYDIYIIWKTQKQNFKKDILKEAILNKFEYRNTINLLDDVNYILDAIKESENLKEYWKNYQYKFIYAENITFEEIMKILDEIVEILLI